MESNVEATPTKSGGMVALVVDSICDTFAGGESTDEKLQVQIVKALLAAASAVDPTAAIHGGILLKAVRTTYNIFLLSKSANTQIVAQATLTQMVQAVFGRVPKDVKLEDPFARSRSSTPTPVSKTITEEPVSVDAPSTESQAGGDGGGTAQVPADLLEVSQTSDGISSGSTVIEDDRKSVASSGIHGPGSIDSLSFDGEHSGVTAALRELGRGTAVRASQDILNESTRAKGTAVDQYIKDAYLVFRALCKLSMKPIPAPEGATDLKSHAMRSKLLSLHLIYTILSSSLYIFFTPSPVLFSPGTARADPSAVLFIHSVKQYLCLSLSRNAVSVVPQVFDISMEIFGKVLTGLRTVLKRELAVIFTEIIIPIMEARASITFHQRASLLNSLQRILSEPDADGGRILVEIYLNYDCDVEAGARENIWERLITAMAKIMTQHYDAVPAASAGSTTQTQQRGGTIAPAITTANLTNFTKEQVRELYSSTGDYQELKRRGLELMVRGVLRPLVTWCNIRAPTPAVITGSADDSRPGRKSEETDSSVNLGLLTDEDSGKPSPSPVVLTRIEDDPTAFVTRKQRKQVLTEGITRFNFKPKKGLQYLLDTRLIPARTPRDIAKFLLKTDGLNKAVIGEFLGEGDEENIAIMHAFVDEMDFFNMNFTDALRHFLQSFRLPGESQKIDRFMLKFAERYVMGNPQSFSSADTAYVLAYSVIMLNTDQHNAQVKKRMTKADFLKNNRGIDNGQDLPVELLENIFDEISHNEIVMKDEVPVTPGSTGTGASDKNVSAPGGNRKEVAQFALASETMALKTEAIFNTMLKSKRKRNSGMVGPGRGEESGPARGFFVASHYEHVRGMFQIIWMSILTGISGPLQESEDVDLVVTALEGFKHATHIACLFEMELEQKAFVSTLGKFTMLSNIQEMRSKNFEAAKCLLEIAYAEGNSLGENWKEVVLCVSQLEKLQVVGNGSDNEGRSRISNDRLQRRDSFHGSTRSGYLQEAAAEASSQSMTLMVDRIFTSSVKLSGAAIVAFVKALCEVSWDEITSSSDREHPKMYCLQRLVEISYYNMNRIRVEWSNIWAILGEHFNQVGCYPNSNVGFFALDKLRQLAMKFLELEELPNFKFQKDFLRPFEHVLGNNGDVKIKDMVLACLQQMIQAKSKSIKSGWKAMFGAFIRAARETHENIVLLAFDIVKGIFKSHFESVVANQTFPDFVSCLVEFCKNKKFGRTSLQSVEILRQSIPRIYELSKTQQGVKLLTTAASSLAIMRSNENLTESVHQGLLASTPAAGTPTMGMPGSVGAKFLAGHPNAPEDDPSFRLWFPIFFGLYEVIMTCDLEVRTRALNYLFDTLKQYGSSFSHDFWEVISKGVLFPIFDDLRLSRQEHTKFANKEDMSVWLSTTLIQALRQFIDLFGHYFEILNFQIDGVVELLTVCMTQENETLARIGSTCLQQFIEGNVQKLTDAIWEKFCNMFVHLFEVTTPHALFFDPNDTGEASVEGESGAAPATQPVDGSVGTPVDTRPRRPRPQKKEFQQIIVKCVLHLLVIQTLHEVLTSGQDDAVYRSLSSRNLLTLIDCLERSYRFARAFNGDMELRMALYRMGFMKQLPNLLKQETSSVSSYLNVLLKMYLDTNTERRSMRSEIEKRLIPLSYEIITHYNSLDPESKRRNVNAWRPVVVTILNALIDFDDDQFKRQMPFFYGEIVNLLLQEITPDMRLVLHTLLIRSGTIFEIISEQEALSATASRNSISASSDSAAGSRRSSRVNAIPQSVTEGTQMALDRNAPLESAQIYSVLPDLGAPEAPTDDPEFEAGVGEEGFPKDIEPDIGTSESPSPRVPVPTDAVPAVGIEVEEPPSQDGEEGSTEPSGPLEDSDSRPVIP
ncbi:hypothetical protein BC832DRAFT_588642 [Gaertneriomyces semiglobifer]|nr:hypothetical protein BC832DRAFT_588642 [Gaertneriomyces semiglobifer]